MHPFCLPIDNLFILKGNNCFKVRSIKMYELKIKNLSIKRTSFTKCKILLLIPTLYFFVAKIKNPFYGVLQWEKKKMMFFNFVKVIPKHFTQHWKTC